MYILKRTDNKIVGVFRTKKGAMKVKRQKTAIEHKESKCYEIERRCFYSTESLARAILRWQEKRQQKKYNKLIRKRNIIERKIKKMKSEVK